MAGPQQSVKRVAITKANAQVVGIVGVAAFISVFCLVSSRALWSQNAYVAKVSGLQQKAHVQLQANLKAADTLGNSYHDFTAKSTNVIGGNSTGKGDNDGDNAKIVLDALPSSYDFPALTSTIEKILTDHNFKVGSITGTDEELTQEAAAAATPSPAPIPMNFSFSVTGAGYDSVQDLMKVLQTSIRPIQVDTISLQGSATDMEVSVTAHTFFQSPKAVNVSSQVVK